MKILKVILISAFVIYLPVAYFMWSYSVDEISRIGDNTSYLINTKGCRIIDMDPYEAEVKKYIIQPKLQYCRPDHFANLDGQILTLNDTVTKSWTRNGTKPVSCCYRSVYRVQQTFDRYNSSADSLVGYSECSEIEFGKPVAVNESFLRVECNLTYMRRVEFHGTVLPPSIHSNATKAKAEYWDQKYSKSHPLPPNILIVGVDSVSRLHLHRSLPKTVQVLQENNFIGVKGYTKIADNTFPNILGALAGIPPYTNSSCLLKNLEPMDGCPLIWKNFSRLNYITAHLEDYPNIAIFNHEKAGFVRPPVDYYLRPFMRAMELSKQASPNCFGGERSTNFILRQIQEFITIMGGQYPFFHFTWLTSLSHDDFNALRTADDLFANFFTKLTNHKFGNPDNTVIVFMSDHGFRIGGFRETFMGFYEANLPFFYIRLPGNLKRRHSSWHANLLRNSDKLTTPLNLYATLADLLKEATTVVTTTDDEVEKKYVSFFDSITETLTCDDAHIPSEYCMCGVTPNLSNITELSPAMGTMIVDQINQILKPEIAREYCSKLKFKEFLYGRNLGSGRAPDGLFFKDYSISIETDPGLAHFEAKLRVSESGKMKIMGDISRTNSYGNQSYCVKNAKLKLYCKCIL